MAPTWPLRIALTGGIASGKSAVAAEFAKLGVAIIDSDVLAREVVQPGQPALQAIVDRFGSDMLDAQGQLNRARMRVHIFNNPAEKQALEGILHPAIRAAQQARSAQLGGPYQIHVIPLLVESDSKSRYDRLLVVDCPVDTQLARLIKRDGIDETLARQMLDAQATRAQRLAQADDVLENTGEAADLAAKVALLHQRYLQLAQAHAQAHK